MSEARASWLPRAVRGSSLVYPCSLDPAALLQIQSQLAGNGASSLRSVGTEQLLGAWNDTISAFADPRSPERRRLDDRLGPASGLSQRCLNESLGALLEGFSARESKIVIDRAAKCREPLACFVILAANIPGLALQSLLACLALRQPVIFKLATAEPFFTPAFLDALERREPSVAAASAALTWPGGRRDLQDPLCEAVDHVLAYGGADTLSALQDRSAPKLLPFGPGASLAVLSDADPDDLPRTARALARDAVLFDQRGCLSLQVIFAQSNIGALAEAMGQALADAAVDLPPGTAPSSDLVRARLAREEAHFQGLDLIELPLVQGTVIVDPRPQFLASPGLRTIRIHPVDTLEIVPERLKPLRGSLQGAVLLGAAAQELRPRLERLGASHFCLPGKLQSPPASWANGGVDLVRTLSARLRGSAAG